MKGTRVIIPLDPKKQSLDEDPFRWSMIVTNHSGNTLQLQVHIPAGVQVGIWSNTIQTNIKGTRVQRNDYKVNTNFGINNH